MTRRQRRLALIGSALGVLGIAAGLVLYALTDTIVFFHGPTDVVEKNIQPGTRFRLGGLVKQGSLVRSPDQTITFEVTDTVRGVPVTYRGLLPDLFREGQGVVTEGILQPSGVFKADSVLAKHDENYMPREVADALKKQGVWQHAPGKDGKDAAASPAVTSTGAKTP